MQTKVSAAASAFYYFYTDRQGSVHALRKADGTWVNGNYARYDAYGGYRTTPATTVNPGISDRGYTGHRMNNTGNDLGLIYMNARYYLPEVGRFISPDTIVPDPSNPQSYNRYSYVFNRPTVINDPSGNCPWCIGAVGGAIIGGLVGYGTQVYQNMQNGLEFGSALTTDIDPSKIIAGAAIGAVVGGTLGAVAPAAVTYGTVAAAHVQTAAVAAATSHPVATAVVSGLAETTVECALTGGGCGAVDYLVGGATAGLAQRVHGNSRASSVGQHGYEIYDIDSGDVVKVGISGRTLNMNGTSPRANQQVNALNRTVGGERSYAARIVEINLPDRAAALQWERSYSFEQWRSGNSMQLHHRPADWR